MPAIAVLSDIHGNLPAMEAVVADAQARGCTHFANLGDILSGPLWPRETAAWLMERGWPTIAGNHERYLFEPQAPFAGPLDAFARSQCTPAQLGWIAALPVEMALPGAWCTHATPGNDEQMLLETILPDGRIVAADEAEIVARLGACRQDLLLHGHSHVPRQVTLADGRRIANPGSVGLPSHLASQPGTAKAQYLILEKGAVTLLATGYDHECAARRAEANGSPGWARMLRETPPR